MLEKNLKRLEEIIEEHGFKVTPVVKGDVNETKQEYLNIDSSNNYEVIYNKTIEAEPFKKVIGHEDQKKELLNVIEWFKNSKELKAKGVSIPKGVILFGTPGNGKSLLIKEIIKYVDAPVFVFKGEEENVTGGIIEVFKKAREAGHSIIVFDELDLLINKDRRVTRALQENLDGVESDDDILVLSATNNLHEIPSALTRNGRLEKIIEIPDPTGEEALELLKKHFKEFNVDLPNDFDDEETALLLTGITCAGVKSVVNDIVLRNGFENITSEMIDKSIYDILDIVTTSSEDTNIQVAIHEASHATVAMSFSKYFTVNRLKIDGQSGLFQAKQVEEGFWPYNKVIADIMICMAGILAEKIICKEGSRGCDKDLQTARLYAYNLFTQSGYSSCWETLPIVKETSRRETPIKLRKVERKIEKLLRKCERETSAFIKKHTNEIKELGKRLFEKKRLKSSEILEVIGNIEQIKD